ncbi:PAS domain-containing protein [Oceanibaculum pacificum]|uniref:PAS domain-containing protein n=1 Tax=Oceanibaculum pacificum TaxID=580166 RepID=A0A154W4B7_9PROT|nr:PAS domain-containing protein [Oceanibaculum pacificum]KZD08392.1 hypothetical protein AUP43_02010 [Oceanibaculum pacificum]
MVAGSNSWTFLDELDDPASLNSSILYLYRYWRNISPAGSLPGRQHFDPLHVPHLMPRVWMLDVVRPELRLRYRLVGTREVATLERDPTGEWLDEVHPVVKEDPVLASRYRHTVETGRPTYRFGNVRFAHDKLHQKVENIILPFARDGVEVDMLLAFSILYRSDGTEI